MTLVHVHWQGQMHLVGRLHVAERGTAASFEYDAAWLARRDAFSIDPTGLPLQRAVFHAPRLFGAVLDCGPDRWGRLLIERAVRKQVLPEQPWRELDYVLALDDVSRIGALRFQASSEGAFLAPRVGKLPPLLRLNSLLHAVDAIDSETETAADLRFLLSEGSPLGGARPKSAVLLPDGSLAIAKFPKASDTRDIAAGEVLALTLAQEAGIRVAAHRLTAVAGRSVSVITRFDRVGDQRVPFISAASLLGLAQDQSAAYTDIADGIRQFGDAVTAELHELWRRMVFSLLISNYDDHARNHAFLMQRPGQWSLSPAYDVNPVPEAERAQVAKTAISADSSEQSIALALAVADRFALKREAALTILKQVVPVVRQWQVTGKRLRLKAGTLKAYASAFEHELMDEAARLV